MGNINNLKPLAPTPEEARKNGRKGGIASGEARRRKRTMKQALEYLMEVPIKKGKAINVDAIRNLEGINKLNLTTEQAILLAQIQRAMKGDTQAFLAVRDTLGEKPDNNVNFTGTPIVISGDDKLED